MTCNFLYLTVRILRMHVCIKWLMHKSRITTPCCFDDSNSSDAETIKLNCNHALLLLFVVVALGEFNSEKY